MDNFDNKAITKKGRELMAKLLAGTMTAVFTKIVTSDYDSARVRQRKSF